jgi:hypothetical protein
MGLPLDEVRGRIGALGNCAIVRLAVRDGIIERGD